MLPDCEDIYLSFPWIKEVWLFGPNAIKGPTSDGIDLLLVSHVPPREVRRGDRRRLLADLQARSDRPIELRLTTREQLSKWLRQGGRFAIAFRKRAVKLFPSRSVASPPSKP